MTFLCPRIQVSWSTTLYFSADMIADWKKNLRRNLVEMQLTRPRQTWNLVCRMTTWRFVRSTLTSIDVSCTQSWKVSYICVARCSQTSFCFFNPLECRGNYSATSNNVKLVHWPLMSGLLHLVQRGDDWAGPQPALVPPRCTKCNSPLINGNDV